MSREVSRETRQALTEAAVTLNGEPARITGSAMPFAKVTQLATGLSAEWSWQAAERVVSTRNGEFRS